MSDIADIVEGELDALGLPYKRRDSGWVIAATARTPCEIDIAPNDNEVLLEAVLVRWDDIRSNQREALRRLIHEAAAQLPGVWAMISEQRASLIAAVPGEAIERDLGKVIERLMRASRLLAREASALVETELAESYLRFFAAPREEAPRRDVLEGDREDH